MKFEWFKDDPRDIHLLCLIGYRSLFFRGTLFPEQEGERLWRSFPKGEPQIVSGELEKAKSAAESMARIKG